MKKISLLSFLLIILSVTCFAQSKNQRDSLRQVFRRDSLRNRIRQDSLIRKFKEDSIKMSFNIKAVGGGELKSNNLLLELDFKNISNEKIKLLDLFDDLSKNFYIQITCEDHKTILPFGFGTIADFPAFYKYKYIEIAKRKSYKHTINLSEILKTTSNGLVLPKGNYKIKMSYRNKNGKDCIMGIYNSQEITISVIE